MGTWGPCNETKQYRTIDRNMKTRKHYRIYSTALIIGATSLLCVDLQAQSNWVRKANMPTARCSLAVCALDGKIYVIGGGVQNQVVTTAVEQYDPATDTWSTKASMHTARGFFGAAALNGKIYAVGGWGMGSVALAACEVYDPASDTWTQVQDLHTPRFGAAAAAANGKIYVFGVLPSRDAMLQTGQLLSCGIGCSSSA